MSRGRLLGKLAEHFRFGHDDSVNRCRPVHLRNAGLALTHLHLDTQLVAGQHRLAKLCLLDRGEQNKAVLAIRHFLQNQNACHLRHRFDD